MSLTGPALTGLLIGTAVLVAALAGPWLATSAARFSTRDAAARATRARVAGVTALLAVLLAGVAVLAGPRPAALAFGWAAAAGVVLGAVDLASHRLPDRVTLPAYLACGAFLAADAAVLGTWPALLRAVLAAAAAFGVAALAALASPQGLGFGDVKLLGLLGLLLGWAGWGVLLAGVFLGLLAGAVGALALVVTRRGGWRTAVPFGPPLLAGAVMALALAGPAALP